MSAFSKIVKHTSTVTAIALLLATGSVAQAFNGMQINPSANLTKAAPSTALQLADMVCQGNWVGAGCTDSSAGSSGGQGSTNSATEKPDCVTYFPSQPTIFQTVGCGGKEPPPLETPTET